MGQPLLSGRLQYCRIVLVYYHKFVAANCNQYLSLADSVLRRWPAVLLDGDYAVTIGPRPELQAPNYTHFQAGTPS